MHKYKAPAEGDRIDIGGKLPQFDAFAWFAYRELVRDNLVWIKVADPKAYKLDDIQYATKAQIHAYQIKWSNKRNPDPFSYNDFKSLFLDCVSGWQALKVVHASEHKKIIAHLLTNRPISTQDSIKDGDTKIGSFTDFIKNVWQRLKIQQDIDSKWKPIIESLRVESKLSEADFLEVIEHFEFHPEYDLQEFKIGNLSINKQEEDLIHLSRFLIEEFANKDKTVQYTHRELINALGPAWQARFKTTFNHELIIDKSNYQPITSTLNELDQKLKDFISGYLFLVGGPGTGKSTLLTDWSKNRKERVIRYYAFDFTNPSSLLNDHERGEAVNLFFDLVFQLKQAKVHVEDIQPYKDLTYLKTVFERQLETLGSDYSTRGTKTVIIIDGLDHIPREYTKTSNSLLAHLPNPNSLPGGVYIILGSQSYDLNDLRLEIRLEFEKQERTVKIASLARKEVFEYIDSSELAGLLSDQQKQTLFEKSQGHPLYLSYLTQKVIQSDNKSLAIDDLDVIEGDINTYYRKIWEPISGNLSLVDLLGLIARISASVSPQFIKEWGFDSQVLSDFRKNAKFLFDESQAGWSFFHNSFRLFLIHSTCLDPLTAEFDDKLNRNYHLRLAEIYSQSSIERPWKREYHLYMAGEYDEFLVAANPNEFVDQFLNFRPVEEIRRDIKLGIELAKNRKDAYLLVRYLFALSELERRLFNINPVSLIKEFLELNEAIIAKNYIRTGKTLLCSESFALMASRLFVENGDKVEACIIFNIAEPEYISKNGITVDNNHRYDEIQDTLEEWVRVAPYFYKLSDILSKLNNIEFLIDENGRRPHENESELRIRLLESLGQGLINQRKWSEFESTLQEFDLSQKPHINTFFILLQDAIEESLVDGDINGASKWLSLLLKQFPKDKAKSIMRIYLSDLIYKITGDIGLVKEWITDIPQPPLPKWDSMGYEGSLRPFMAKIKLNKLLNLCGVGVPITQAAPNAVPGSDEEVAVEFERMLCLTTQLLCEGLEGKLSPAGKLKPRVFPIVRFYYKDVSYRNSYWYRITQSKAEYFDFLVYAVSLLGQQELDELGDYLIEEFVQSPRYWSTSEQRKVLLSLLTNGFDNSKVRKHLTFLESTMLEGHDISGRIDECTAHARAWNKLSENELAKMWIQRAIKESLGVGYRKDYQFSSWIEWLQKINRAEPLEVKDKILWFLSHLRHIEQTTEGRAYVYAAEEILQTTFQWNFAAARQQLEWQLDHELISFQDALLTFIQNFLEKATSVNELEKIIHLYTEIYLYVSSVGSNKIVSTFLEKGFEMGGTGFLDEHLPRLVEAINIKSLEETRFGLLTAIDGFGKAINIDVASYVSDFNIPLNPDRSSSSNNQNNMVLKDGHERLTEKEVLDRVSDYASFKELIKLEDKANSYFKWDNVIEKIAPAFSIEQIQELSEYDRLGRRESDFFAKLSGCALDLENMEVARKLAEKAISFSNDYGWDKWYDGGTRITAFLALKNIEPEFATSKAFEFLAHDAVNYSDPGSLCQQLEDILPSITLVYDVKVVWKEVFDHLKRLMSTSTPSTDLPDLDPLDQPIIEDLIDLLLYLSKNPVKIISQNAQKLLALFITVEDDNSQEKLKALHGGEEEEQEILVHILMMADVCGKKDILNLFINELRSLASSHNYQIRSYSSRILTTLNQEVPIPTKRKLPQLYSLYLEEERKPDFGIEEDPLNPKFNLNDPEDLIKPYNGWVNILEDKTGINRINLLQRMVAIMKNVDDPDKWTLEFEDKLSHHLKKINLKYSYQRPRARAAKRALMHLVTELIDADVIDSCDIAGLFHMHDHAIHFFPEVKKPEFIPRLVKGERSSPPSDWIEQIEKNERLNEGLVEYKKGWYIIGEYTKVRSLAWDKPTEIYMTHLVPRDANKDSDHHIFGSAFEILTDDYSTSRVPGRNIIFIREHYFDQFDRKSCWIAINPVLARYLEWSPEPSHLFGWNDIGGNLMVRSIYWGNGNIDMPPPHYDYEVGQGWFVIASQHAIDQIREIEPDLVIQKEVNRNKSDDGKHKEKTISKIISIT